MPWFRSVARQAPDPTPEHDVVAVVHLGQVVEGAGLLGVGHDVGAALVGDLDEPFLNVDVGVAVLPHCPQLDEVNVGVGLLNGVHHVQVADDVVDLGVDRVLAVDHGIGGGTLLAEVDDGVGLRLGDDAVRKRGVGEVPDPYVNGVTRHLFPARDPFFEGSDRHQAVHTHFEVVLPAHQIVDDGDLVPESRQMQSRGPTEITVSSENQNLHFTRVFTQAPRLLRSRYTFIMGQIPEFTL